MRRRQLLQHGMGLTGLGLAGCIGGENCPEEARISVDESAADPPGTPTQQPCQAVDNRRFRSLGRYGDSFTGPDRPGVHHTVEFEDGEFVYMQTDTGYSGTVTCRPSDCLAAVTGYGPDGAEFSGTYDPVSQLLRWEGTLFRLVGRAD